MTCLIIEDQPPAQRLLKKYIEDLGTLELKACFSDALKAIEFLKRTEVDLIFLDIHLPKISGIDFLKSLAHPPAVILTTAFSDYALESYEFNVVDYLLKPYSFQRFVKAVSKIPIQKEASLTNLPLHQGGAVEKQSIQKELFIKSGYELIRVTIADILYIQSDADYTEIFIPDKKYLSSHPLVHWQESLREHEFIRIHKSYIINASKIQKLSANLVYLSDNISLPIGRAYKDDFMKRLVK